MRLQVCAGPAVSLCADRSGATPELASWRFESLAQRRPSRAARAARRWKRARERPAKSAEGNERRASGDDLVGAAERLRRVVDDRVPD